MELKLMGTGAAEGCPGLFCHCQTCTMARTTGGKNIRSRTSALIDDIIKIDFPPDIFHQVVTQNVDLGAMQVLLFTHEHDDHFNGAQLQYMGSYFVTQLRPVPLQVYGPPEVIQWLQTNLHIDRLPITLHTLEALKPVQFSDYQILPFPAQHDPSTTCFNYIISDTTGASLLYATDTGWYTEETWSLLERSKLSGIVCECQKGFTEEGYKGHLSIPEVIRMRQRLLCSGTLNADAPMIVTHLSHMANLSHQEWEQTLAPHHILVGYDGMKVNISATFLPD